MRLVPVTEERGRMGQRWGVPQQAGLVQLKGPGAPTPATLKGLSGLLNGDLGCAFPRDVLRI